MKIAVVGPIPRDTIITHKKEVIKKYGCVTHPTIALAKLLVGMGTVIPITHVRQKDSGPIKALFQPYNNIDLSGIDDSSDTGTVIELTFLDQNRRVEKQTACMKPIMPEDVAPYLDCEVFVFVPITDFEVSLETLKFIKSHSKAKIVFDAHGPTNCMSVNGNRYQKFWIDRDEWLPFIDVLKMNQEESHCCWFKPEYESEELGHFDENDVSHFDDFGAHVLKQGVEVLYVTMDSRGCQVYFNAGGEVKKDFVPSVAVGEVVDTTGCGDSFAGGLAFGFAKSGMDPIKAAQYANALGALRTQGKTFDVFKSLGETEALMAKNY